MDQKKYIEKLIKEGKRVKLITRNNDFYAGILKGLSENSILLFDRNGDEVMIFLEHIQTIKAINGEQKKEGEK